MKVVIRQCLNVGLDLFLSRTRQQKLGDHIEHRARGENTDDASTNGEYALLRRIAAAGLQMETVFDVGANKGEWTVQARRLFGAGTQIFAFEPVPETHAFLTKQLGALPASGRTYAIHLALGDTDGTATMHVSGHLAGSNSIFQRHGTHVQSARTEQVPLQRGDSFCRERAIRRINLLKIDTEGNEMAVLHGFDAMLAKQAIDVIQFEYGGTWIDARAYLGDSFAYLQPRGYRLGKIYPANLAFYDNYDQRMDNFAYSNWIAVRSEIRTCFDKTLGKGADR